MRLIHDPGHGGHNRGLQYAGFVERSWVIDFGHLLMDRLSSLCEYQCMARTSDDYIRYTVRARRAVEWKADLAFLHHVNGLFYGQDHHRAGQGNPHGSGTICFVVPEDELSHCVAEALIKGLPKELWRQKDYLITASPNDWTKNAYGHLSHYTSRGIPAVLIEWGFATNDADRRALQNDKVRDGMAKAAAEAVLRFKELTCKS
jgi:N-acetylmuramoyl-L-alanine amidase